MANWITAHSSRYTEEKQPVTQTDTKHASYIRKHPVFMLSLLPLLYILVALADLLRYSRSPQNMFLHIVAKNIIAKSTWLTRSRPEYYCWLDHSRVPGFKTITAHMTLHR